MYGLLDLLTLYVNVQEALVDKIVIDTDDSEYVLTNSHSCEIMRINKYKNNLLPDKNRLESCFHPLVQILLFLHSLSFHSVAFIGKFTNKRCVFYRP